MPSIKAEIMSILIEKDCLSIKEIMENMENPVNPQEMIKELHSLVTFNNFLLREYNKEKEIFVFKLKPF